MKILLVISLEMKFVFDKKNSKFIKFENRFFQLKKMKNAKICT